MADDDDTIYVDVKARVDEASADEAEHKLRDKFKDITKDIGESIKDATSSIGDHVKDIGESFKSGTLHDIFKDMGHVVGEELKKGIGLDKLGDEITKELAHGSLGGVLDRVSDKITNTTDLIENLGEVFGVHLDGVGSVGHTVSDTLSDVGRRVDKITGKIHSFTSGIQGLKSGDVTGGLNNLSLALKDVAPDGVVDNIDSVNNALQRFTDTHKQIQDTAGDLKETLGLLGLGGLTESGGALSRVTAVAEGAGPIALAATGEYLAIKEYTDWINKQPNFMPAPGVLPNQPFMPAGPPAPRPGIFEGPTAPLRAGPLPGTTPRPGLLDSHSLPTVFGEPTLPGVPIPMPGMVPGAGYRPAPPQDIGLGRPTVSGSGGANVTAQQATVEAGSATVVASSVSLGGLSLPQLGTPSSGMHIDSSWGHGGSASSPKVHGEPSIGGIPLPGLKPATGRASGGILPGGSPGYDNELGVLGGHPIGLEGGEFVVNPDATQRNLSLLKAINSGQLSHFAGGGGPVDPNNPAQPLPPTSGGGGNQPKQQQDIGTGKGMSVGGGMLGMAEQGAAMMAGPMAPAAQIAEQETNLAVQKLTQMAAVAAMAPIETLWLGGGQMGAPAVGSPAKAGWMGKLLGGVIGQGENLPNIAGTVQPPKQPQGPGGQDIHQGPTAAPPAGPQGTADDPMHVKTVGGNQPPQGAMNSYLNHVSPSALLGT